VRVRIEGLTDNAELNMTEGTIVAYQKDDNRWMIRSDLTHTVVGMLPQNLTTLNVEQPKGKDDHIPFAVGTRVKL